MILPPRSLSAFKPRTQSSGLLRRVIGQTILRHVS